MADVIGCKAGKLPFIHLEILVGANMYKTHYWNRIMYIFEKRLSLGKPIPYLSEVGLC